MTSRPTLRTGRQPGSPDSGTGHPLIPDPGSPVSGGTSTSADAADALQPSATVARRRLSIEQNQRGFRRVPNSSEIARRRRLLRWTKWVLPVAALLLLVSIATWPELDRSMNSARLGLKQASHVQVDSGRMLGARYHGLDSHDRPYMITSDEAQQVAGTVQKTAPGTPVSKSDDRVNLTRPIADSLDQSGNWTRISAQAGVYMQHGQLLDLSRDVMLYRDDGIMMTSPVAGLDLRSGVVASDDWVHAEGPFGVLDAQGFLISQRDGLAQFRGPARLVLNDDRVARPATETQPAKTLAAGATR
ncbi:LPS export ABC transporter periplasmic protein LptC [Lichenicola cladoniae]|uniref:LPS export ABC transporter periplasmic protein LptC n=1 Tax=Lichenicola cladoniae TaxID=1484109 RepID=A0A6M8HPF2_9PROT|nr:LPS export ABC transporter periplasmic protein LptC [Lichenicola cladoniae]NPD66432.1 LPS export ABC transporter periplasmic protein LptC [Acetobacteraceae bacterium]QKE90333.1 LPS export ABC transporter periplasmic protein LptC [Lichenicola cladoniae]